MKALSIRQPWAWLILHAGKNIENRSWNSRYPAYTEACLMARDGERFLIHASKGMTRDEYEDALGTCHMISRTHPFPADLTLPAFADLPRGGIVGSARIARVVRDHTSPWFFGPIGLVLTDIEVLPFEQCKGALGFFDCNPHDGDPKPAREGGAEGGWR